MSALDDFAESYKRRWRYYAEDLPEQFATQKIKDLIEKSAEAYRFRLARIPVEALNNRVSIAGITSSVGDRVTRRIEEIRNANDMELQEGFLHERLFVYGDAYCLVWPVEEDEPEAQADGEKIDAIADADTRDVGIELAYQSPLSCRAIYDAEDGRRVRFIIRRWKESSPLDPNGVWRVEVWYIDRLEGFITMPGRKGTEPEDWEEYVEDENGDRVPAVPGANWPEAHDFGELPIKHARTDLPYGRSVLEDFIGPQNLITKATATQASGIESHGWRERYRIADDAQVLDQARDSVNWDDDTNAPKANVVPISGRRSGPGTEQLFTGTKEVGEFSAMDIGGLIDPMEQWVRFGASASATPYSEFDARFGASMSGIARQRADAPMRAKEARHKRFLERFWSEVYGCALRMDGTEVGELTINWAPPEVISDPDWWAVATVRRTHGVPQRTILEEANYTPEDIEAWEGEQDDALLLDARIERIHKLGEALQTLGAGATLLGIPSERIARVVEDLLGDAGSPGKLVLEEKEVPPALDPNADTDEEETDDATDREPAPDRA